MTLGIFYCILTQSGNLKTEHCSGLTVKQLGLRDDCKIANACRYAFYVGEHLLRDRGRKMLGWNGTAGIVVGYSAGARLLLSHGFQKPTPQPFVGGGGNSDKRITPAERAPPSTPCAPSFVLVVKSSFVIIIITIIICT
jgi:hypothetical protein